MDQEAYRGLETDLRESETEREWTDGQNQGEVAADEAYHKSIQEQLKRHKNRRTLDQSRRLWETEFNLRRMSEQELAEFVDDLDPMVKGKLWAALENSRHD